MSVGLAGGRGTPEGEAWLEEVEEVENAVEAESTIAQVRRPKCCVVFRSRVHQLSLSSLSIVPFLLLEEKFPVGPCFTLLPHLSYKPLADLVSLFAIR